MTIHSEPVAWFDFLPRKSLEIHQVDQQVSSDAGLVVFRELDDKLGLRVGSQKVAVKSPSIAGSSRCSIGVFGFATHRLWLPGIAVAGDRAAEIT